MREVLTSSLDALAVLLVAAGIGCLASGASLAAFADRENLPLLIATGVGLTVAGFVVLFFSWLASRPPPRNEADQ